MATQSFTLPDRLVLTEDQFNNLREQADEQNISMSEALARAIVLSGVVVKRTSKNPATKILLKNGNEYREVTTTWR
ncbi:MAG: hypothetical protein INR62_04845 [Rhodospirillales bacterium]|nr:hypothetical protein [Acetobacter sp.]